MTSWPAYFGRGAVRGLEDGDLVADVGAGRHAQAADLGRARIGEVVAVEVGRREHRTRRGASELLEHAVGDAVLDEHLALAARALATSSSVTMWSPNSALANS